MSIDTTLTATTIIWSVGVPLGFFAWIVVNRPSISMIAFAVFTWALALAGYGWFILGWPEAHFEPHGLFPLIALALGISYYIVVDQYPCTRFVKSDSSRRPHHPVSIERPWRCSRNK